MIVEKKKENTVQIVASINTVLLSECCHSYLGKYIIAHSGEKCNRNCTKCANFCSKIFMKKNNTPEVSYFDK